MRSVATLRLLLAIAVLLELLLLLSLIQVSVTQAAEQLTWTYVELKVDAPKTLPTTVAPIITYATTEYEWVNDRTIVGFFSQADIDNLEGYPEVVYVGAQRTYTTHLSILFH